MLNELNVGVRQGDKQSTVYHRTSPDTGEDGYLYLKDADVFEPVDPFVGKFPTLSRTVATTLLKSRLHVDLKPLERALTFLMRSLTTYSRKPLGHPSLLATGKS